MAARVILSVGQSIGAAAPGLKAAAYLVAAWRSPQLFLQAAGWLASTPARVGVSSGSTLLLFCAEEEQIEQYRAYVEESKPQIVESLEKFLCAHFGDVFPTDDTLSVVIREGAKSDEGFIFISESVSKEEQAFWEAMYGCLQNYSRRRRRQQHSHAPPPPPPPPPVLPQSYVHYEWLSKALAILLVSELAAEAQQRPKELTDTQERDLIELVPRVKRPTSITNADTGLESMAPYKGLSEEEFVSKRKEKSFGRKSIGLCFSGGGFRAFFECIGFLWALIDADLLNDTIYVTGISGGSWAVMCFLAHLSKHNSVPLKEAVINFVKACLSLLGNALDRVCVADLVLTLPFGGVNAVFSSFLRQALVVPLGLEGWPRFTSEDIERLPWPIYCCAASVDAFKDNKAHWLELHPNGVKFYPPGGEPIPQDLSLCSLKPLSSELNAWMAVLGSAYCADIKDILAALQPTESWKVHLVERVKREGSVVKSAQLSWHPTASTLHVRDGGTICNVPLAPFLTTDKHGAFVRRVDRIVVFDSSADASMGESLGIAKQAFSRALDKVDVSALSQSEVKAWPVSHEKVTNMKVIYVPGQAWKPTAPTNAYPTTKLSYSEKEIIDVVFNAYTFARRQMSELKRLIQQE